MFYIVRYRNDSGKREVIMYAYYGHPYPIQFTNRDDADNYVVDEQRKPENSDCKYEVVTEINLQDSSYKEAKQAGK